MTAQSYCVVRRIIINPFLIIKLWMMYMICFGDQDEVCAQDQICMETRKPKKEGSFRKTPSRLFLKAMVDKNWYKVLLYTKEENLIGLAVATSDFERSRVGYINPDIFVKATKKKNGIFYVPVIAILPEYQDFGNPRPLLKKLFELAWERNGEMVSCDFSEKKNGYLPEVIVRILNEMVAEGEVPKGDFSLKNIDRQLYVGIYYEREN